MRERLAKFSSWGRRFFVLGALIGAPVLAAPAAEAQTIQAVIGVATPAPELVPVQWIPPPHHSRPRRWHRPPPPPPRHWRRHHAYRHRPPPPPPRYYRHHRPHYYR
ncbi:hypothetical protein [Roseomonas xinghualingensis]|uniref:hypothetical protein n=1 Tax=Roseomonas xinghualingensis TaxID=2986475 RepID=UPI0021F1083F|nr:hypothetical protein [Roseomonas sp. SXEYE001]MCV4208447.1 hypothetical protein [Roseomonas sp. SXEYE001]